MAIVLEGSSANLAIDLTSDDEVELQVPVAPVPTRVAKVAEQQPVRVYNTRAVTRAQSAAGSGGSQVRATVQTEMDLVPNSSARSTRATARATRVGNSTTGSADAPQRPFPSRTVDRQARTGTKSGQATAPARTAGQLSLEERFIRTKPVAGIEKVGDNAATHPRIGNTETQLPDVNDFSTGPLHAGGDAGAPTLLRQQAFQQALTGARQRVDRVDRLAFGTPSLPRNPFSSLLYRSSSHESERPAPTAVSQPFRFGLDTAIRSPPNLDGFAAQHEFIALSENVLPKRGNKEYRAANQLVTQQYGATRHGDMVSHSGCEMLAARISNQLMQDVRWAQENGYMPPHQSRPGREANNTSISLDKNNAVSSDVPSMNNITTPRGATPLAFRQQSVVGGQVTMHQHVDFPQPHLLPQSRGGMDIILPQNHAQNPPRARIQVLSERHAADAGRTRNTVQEKLSGDRHGISHLNVRQRDRKRLARQARRLRVQNRARNTSPDLVILSNAHRNLDFWKSKLAEELRMGPEMDLVYVAAASFDRRSIQTVVPNRYFAKGSRTMIQQRFPGFIEKLLEKPLDALRKAYEEHRAEKVDPSRLVLWTDGSASGSRQYNESRGFAVAWRRSTERGWGAWEAAGYQGT
ncbi:hypothetical protein BU23DRAFT_22763 [Bimuria novae-zelandiae CBS 107.79]|uniref:Uncharacterized protein n=1 Tax=Bimuria novae-zelandiae CBS 107.79 TaxID=1447943 RepID=A0A6A5UKQ4_9PLEO|nr:hypothetical protein BU23DRAFT_22763 [Bimuria novae-zelandiae CBS 107.79]